ncbi:MAG: DUF3540 domain-containing protein [Polyangiaceae bacterium]
MTTTATETHTLCLHTPRGAAARLVDDAIELRSSAGTLIARLRGTIWSWWLRGRSGSRQERIELDAPEIIAQGRDVTLAAARRLELEAPEATVEVGRWKLRAERVVVRALDLLEQVERLYETRAGSWRRLVRRSAELVAQRTTIRSELETRVDGQRVLLG